MRTVKSLELVPFPETQIQYNFSFDCVAETGNFNFEFRFFNDRWNCWVTLPSGDVRQIGVYPNVISGTGNIDYGFVFKTRLPEIGYNDLFITELYILKWE